MRCNQQPSLHAGGEAPAPHRIACKSKGLSLGARREEPASELQSSPADLAVPAGASRDPLQPPTLVLGAQLVALHSILEAVRGWQ